MNTEQIKELILELLEDDDIRLALNDAIFNPERDSGFVEIPGVPFPIPPEDR